MKDDLVLKRFGLRAFRLMLLVAALSVTASMSKVFALAAPPIAATDVIGQADFGSNSELPAAATSLHSPSGVAVDTVNHRLFVADAGNNRVLVYNLDSSNNLVDKTADFVIGQPNFTSNDTNTTQDGLDFGRGGVIFDSANNRLFVSDEDNCRIMIYNTATITNGMNASNVLGQDNFTLDIICSTDISSFNYNESTPSYDPDRELLFVPEYGNNRVMIFDVKSITNGENAVSVLGQYNFTSESNALSANGVNLEFAGSVYDPSTKRFYLSDGLHNRVLVYNLTTISDGMAASYVLGQPDFTTGGDGTDKNSLSNPGGLALDVQSQVLYVLDVTNNRILLFDVSTITNNEDAINVIGQPDFTSSTPGLSATELQPGNTTGLFFDETTETLYVPEFSNNRMLMFSGLYDDDGITSAVENGAPNDGDGNGDGAKDALQEDVTSIPNGESGDTGDYITLVSSGCDSITALSVSAEDAIADDTDYRYPVGLADFTIACTGLNDKAVIKIYYDEDYDTTDWTARKYINGEFSEVTGATFSTATVGASTVTTLTYTVTDGGSLDADGIVNGIIVDPVGPGVLDAAPTASAVSITDDNGDDAEVGDSLTGGYTYADVDSDLEGTSTFRWLRDDAVITDATALTYTLVDDDADTAITFEVTPVDATGNTGDAVTSSAIEVEALPGGGALSIWSLFIGIGLGLGRLFRLRKHD